MRKKKILAMMLVAMLSLSGLTGCSDKDKEDMNNKLNNKTTETTDSKKDNKDDKTSESKNEESKNEESKTENTDSKNTESSESKKDNTSDSKKNESTSTKTDNKKNESTTSSKKDDKNNSASKPAHQHTWVDHTATKTVHHDAVYKEVTIPAVTKWQIRCLGCGQYFDTHADLDNHALKVQWGMESGDPQRCGSCAADAEREVVITPAKTERQLVQDAWDETQTYVDYQYCSGCGQHK